MNMRTRHATLLAALALVSGGLITNSARAADGCDEHPTFGNISGSLDTVELSGAKAVQCTNGDRPVAATQIPEPYYTEQIVCSTDPVQASAGLCSATPCPTSFFALRTLHLPNGQAKAAGFRCVTLDQAVATPGVTIAQLFEAVRRVRLPGGEIGVEPEVRGWRIWSRSFGWRGRARRRWNFRLVGRRCGRSFGWWSTSGALVGGSRW